MYLYHILPFHRLVEVFETRQLYFSSPTTWDDPYEETVAGNLVNWVSAQCWCKLGVSDAMWRIYSPDRLQFASGQRLTRSPNKSEVASAAMVGVTACVEDRWTTGE